MNEKVKPGDDFFLFINQDWLESHPIPEEKSAYGAFTEVQDRTEERLHQIIQGVVTSPADERELKIANFFRLGMNEEKIEKEGIEGIASEQEGVTRIHDRDSLLSVLGRLQILGIAPLFSLFAEADPRESTMMIATLEQGGLGLPNKKYYLLEDHESEDIRVRYRDYICRMLSFAGGKKTEPEEEAERILQLETRLAHASLSPEENRDPLRTYHKMSLQDLEEQTPHFNWTGFLQIIGYPEIDEINVHQPVFLREVDSMMEEILSPDWQAFLRWKLLLSTAPFLDSRFVNETFRFYGKTLQGEIQIRPRWKRVLEVLNGALGEDVGRLYVRKHFPEEAKEQAITLISHIRQAFRSRIQMLSWMGTETQGKALEKLDAMRFKIGYPKKWRDYRMLEVQEDSYVRNVLRAREFEFRSGPAGLDRAGKPVDPEVWFMTPQTVNAYYNPEKNEMVFPAAIFQPPFFSMDVESRMNYGAIGAVIGHEMIHGFDDTGRKFDQRGNLAEWWSPQDEKEFTERTWKLKEQYSAYEALPGLQLNGELTLGENIADLGGLTLALHASRIARGGEGTSTEELRQFFQGYARIWRENIREEALRQQVLTDPHAPTRFRVNGVVRNMDEFYRAYPEVGPGDALYLPSENRIHIW